MPATSVCRAAAVGLWDEGAAHRLRPVSPGVNPVAEVPDIRIQVLPVVRHRHPIHPGAGCPPLPRGGSQERFVVHMVQQRRAAGLARSEQSLVHLGELGWQRCPVLCPVPRRPAQSPLGSGPSLRLARFLRPHRQYYTPIRHPVSARPAASVVPCRWPPPATSPEAPTGLPRFRHVPFVREMASDPGRAAAPRITAPFMLPSPQRTGSASATSVISWLNPIPHTIAVYASAPPLPVGPATLATGRLATPYPGGTSTRWTAPASPGAPAATGVPTIMSIGLRDWAHGS